MAKSKLNHPLSPELPPFTVDPRKPGEIVASLLDGPPDTPSLPIPPADGVKFANNIYNSGVGAPPMP